MKQISIRVSVAVLGLSLAACEVGTAEQDGPVQSEFVGATATSWVAGDLVSTELRGADGAIAATAEWDVPSRTGVLSTDTESIPITLAADGQVLDAALANVNTYSFWTQTSATEAAYHDVQCTVDYPDACTMCIWCRVCIDLPWGTDCNEGSGCYQLPDC